MSDMIFTKSCLLAEKHHCFLSSKSNPLIRTIYSKLSYEEGYKLYVQ